jgi:pimeloyl-ACP methyl ester carboxylesterase
MPRLTVHGAALHYDDTGAGAATPVVFAHGLLWSGAMFDPQVAALRATRRCVRFDFRSQGRSAFSDAGNDIDTLADDAAAVVAALGVGPCHFVGLSMGGFVGLRLAAYRPALLRSLTLIASAADPEPPRNAPKYRAMLLGARAVGMGPLVPSVMRIMFGEAFLRDPARAAERDALRAHLAALDVRATRRATEGVIRRRGVTHLLAGIRTPTQVIAGEADTAVVPARQRRTAEGIAGARFVSIPRAGHTTTLEEPAAVTAALEGFFAAVESGGQSA